MISPCATWNQTGITVAGNENGTSGSDLGSFSSPIDIFVDSSYTLFVVDGSNNRVVKYYVNAVSGILVAGNLTAGSSSSQFNQPKGIAIDQAGDVIIGDTANYRIQKFPCGSTVVAFFLRFIFAIKFSR
jgi:DNA-binding beta-propeller fold protein YncE